MNRQPPIHISPNLSLRSTEDLARLAGLNGSGWQMAREDILSGSSGAFIERLQFTRADSPPRTVILKQLDPGTNWIMRSSEDNDYRELAFALSPFHTDLPEQIVNPVIAAGVLRSGIGALLMEDIAPTLLPASLAYETVPPDSSTLDTILDGMATLHAHFWNNSSLATAAWLTPPQPSLLLMTSANLEAAGAFVQGKMYNDAALRMWPYLWEWLNERDADTIRLTIDHPESILRAVASLPHTLVHGDAWVGNIGVDNETLFLVDWALVTAGPATYDPMWIAQTWHILNPDNVLTRYRSFLLKHGVTEVEDDATWSLLTDIAWVRTYLLGAEWMVRDVRGAQSNDEEQEARTRLLLWSQRVARILRLRGW